MPRKKIRYYTNKITKFKKKMSFKMSFYIILKNNDTHAISICII